MPYQLPALPYAYDALEPHIDAKTMEIHHSKHHNAYVTNLNAALEGHADLSAKPICELCSNILEVPEAIRGAVRNNGGGHLNHSMFWDILTPGGSKTPTGEVAKKLESDLGGLDKFKEAFTKAALTRFGSGWAWLGEKDGKLVVTSTPNQDNPIMKGVAETPCKPILGIDVWEHAYYLKYQNRRADYIAGFFNAINWDKVSEFYAKVTK